MSGVRETSLEAYEELRGGPALGEQQRRVLGAVWRRPGLTRAELSEFTGMRLSSVCARVNELIHLGMLAEGRKRPCTRSGRKAYPLVLAPVERPAGPSQGELRL